MNVLEAFFNGLETGINWIFILLPEIMRSMAFTLVLSTLGKITAKKQGWKWLLAKFLLGFFYGIYFYMQVVKMRRIIPFDQVFLSIQLILVGMFLILIFIGKNIRIWGYKIFNYYTSWIFYGITLVVYSFIGYINGMWAFSIFFFALCMISLIATKTRLKNEIKGNGD